VQDVGLKVTDVVVLIDREQGGPARLQDNNLALHSAFTLTAILKVPTAMSTCYNFLAQSLKGILVASKHRFSNLNSSPLLVFLCGVVGLKGQRTC